MHINLEGKGNVGSKNEHKKDTYLKEFGLHAKNTLNILGLMVNINEETCMTA
jgi:hypothetical protein